MGVVRALKKRTVYIIITARLCQQQGRAAFCFRRVSLKKMCDVHFLLLTACVSCAKVYLYKTRLAEKQVF